MSLVKDYTSKQYAIEEGVSVGDWLISIIKRELDSIKNISESNIDNLKSQYLTHVSNIKTARFISTTVKENELSKLTESAIITKIDNMIIELNTLITAKEKILAMYKPTIKATRK